MTYLLKDLAGVTGSLLWPVNRPIAVWMLTWAGSAPDLGALGEPTRTSDRVGRPTLA